MTTQARKDELTAAGYAIEDMGEEWGDEFAGQFRWINTRHSTDGFGAIQYSEADAWADASQFNTRYGF